MASAPARALSVHLEDPVLAAMLEAPLDDMPESEEEREAVEAAKASGRMVRHAAIEATIEGWRRSG